MFPDLSLLAALQDLAIPNGITDAPTAGFYAGVVAAFWILERAFAYVSSWRKDELTPAAVAEAVKQELTSTELEAMRDVVDASLEDRLRGITGQVETLYDWHDREDPDRPGWKIWWVSSRDFRKLLEVAERQTDLDRELLAALDRRAELDRLLLTQLETLGRAAATAAQEASAAHAGQGVILAKLETLRGGMAS